MGFHILQFAVMGLTEIGIRVCAPVHDAVLTECRIEEIDQHTAEVERTMRLGSEVALGMEIPVGTVPVEYPNRYMDDRGASMFDRVTGILASLQSQPGTDTNITI
jgi:hypothetical protein